MLLQLSKSEGCFPTFLPGTKIKNDFVLSCLLCYWVTLLIQMFSQEIMKLACPCTMERKYQQHRKKIPFHCPLVSWTGAWFPSQFQMTLCENLVSISPGPFTHTSSCWCLSSCDSLWENPKTIRSNTSGAFQGMRVLCKEQHFPSCMHLFLKWI